MLVSTDFTKAFTECLGERTNGGKSEEALNETNSNAAKALARVDAAEKGPEETTEVALTSMEAVQAAFKRVNDAVDETVKNIDERVKIIAESEGFKDTKSKVDETVQATMAKVGQYADQLFDALKEKEAEQPKDEARNDDNVLQNGHPQCARALEPAMMPKQREDDALALMRLRERNNSQPFYQTSRPKHFSGRCELTSPRPVPRQEEKSMLGKLYEADTSDSECEQDNEDRYSAGTNRFSAK